MIKTLKSEKGIAGIDLTISIIIIMLFVSIIATLSMNVSTSLTSKKRIEIATNCMTEIMEKVDSMSYENVEEITDFETILPAEIESPISLKENVQNILWEEELEEKKGYHILQVQLKTEKYEPENYTPDIEDDTSPDLVKKVTVKITYNEDEALEVTRLKTRYNVNLEKNDATEN